MPVAVTPAPEPKQLPKALIQNVSLLAAPRSGRLNVWLPTVKSADETVAVKGVVPVALGAMAILSELAVVEIKVVGAVVELVILTPPEPAFKAREVVPVLLPAVIVLALALVPKLTSPVVPESKVKADDVVELIVPAPAKVKAVAEVAMVSRELTELKAPELMTTPLMVLEEVGAVIAPAKVGAPAAVTLKLVPLM